MKAFSKWTALWRRYALERRPGQAQSGQLIDKCNRVNRAACLREDWEKFISQNQNLPDRQKLDAANAFMNTHPYIVDPVNWGLPDYWATPGEFFMKDGDCEDYAISKYVTLKRLGLAPSSMRLVVVQDENLRTPHAVLAVELDGDTLILDNQVNQVISHQNILHYRPVYSINEDAWWLHHRIR